MKFYQLQYDSQNIRNDGEYWSIKSNQKLTDFQQKHYNIDSLLHQEIDDLEIHVYSDFPLGDVVNYASFYDCFWVSERLQGIFADMNIQQEQIQFFEKQIQWRQKFYSFYWLQTFKLKNENACFNFKKSRFINHSEQNHFQIDEFGLKYFNINWFESEVWLTKNIADFDLFRLPKGPLGQSLYCSERLKNTVEENGIIGLKFTEAPFLKVSDILKPVVSKPIPKAIEIPQITRIPTEFELALMELRYNPPAPIVNSDNLDKWIKSLFKYANTEKNDKTTLLPFLKNHQKTAISVCFNQSLSKNELIDNPTSSRFWGKPFLSKRIKWPEIEEGKPLLFIGQINLSDLPKNEELPSTGLLSFFIDVYGSTNSWPMQKGRSYVHYSSEIIDHKLHDFPENLILNEDFQSISLYFKRGFDLPDDRYFELFDDSEKPEKGIYDDFSTEIREELGFFPSENKLLGWPRCIQGYVGAEAVVYQDFNGDWNQYQENENQIKLSARDWRLLFQFEANQIGLGDQFEGACVYFLIKENDLKSGDFSKTALIMQCT
jgi:uncharacterized protein YwqG